MKNNSNRNKPDKRGRPVTITDYELKQIAIDVKGKLKGQKLTFLQLEKQTGIGRHIWKRRMSDIILDLNKPVHRDLNQETDDIYFPNIEELFEKYRNNKSKIISELLFFQSMFQDLYSQLTNFKKERETWVKIKDLLEKQSEEIKLLRKQLKHYEELYKSLVVSSAFSHLREKNAIKENLLEFKKDVLRNSSLNEKDLQSFFPNKTVEESKKVVTEEHLRSAFPNLFNSDKE